jgi:hypothetical protein
MEAPPDAALEAALRGLAARLSGEALAEALTDFGWEECLSAAPRSATAALFEGMGRAGSRSAAIHDVVRNALLVAPPDDLAVAGVVSIPPPGEVSSGVTDSGRVWARGFLFGGKASAGEVLFAVTAGRSLRVVAVGLDALASLRAVSGLDPRLELVEVTAFDAPARTVLAGDRAVAAWQCATAAGRRALAHQITGAARRMLELAVEHAKTRHQFGSPIGSFQAVRHRLAEAYVAVEAATAATAAAWEADDPVLASMLAKSLAGRAARVGGRHCQQVLAGIGFTAEHPFHLFLTRALVLDTFLGSSSELPRAIGRALAARGGIPRLVEL